jgi:pteridine reductase
MADSEKRVALVTGGAKRVGRAIVEKLATEGFAVAFTYLSSQNEADELAKQFDAHAIQIDLTKTDQLEGTIRELLETFSDRIDVLVNSASIYEPSSMNQATLEQMGRLMAIHFEAPLLLTRALAPKLRAARGHVINMIDLLAERPWPDYLAYCASKAALMNLTLGLARELAPECTVNGIAPGVVEWPPGYPEQEKQKYLKRVPLGRAGTPEDVANLVHFLATEGDYITGQIIRVDGGRSIT